MWLLMDFWLWLMLFMNPLCTNFQSKHKCKIIEHFKLKHGTVPHTQTYTLTQTHTQNVSLEDLC